MNFTEEQLKTIEEMGSLFYFARQIAVVLEVDPYEFELLIQSETPPAFSSYMKGWYESDIKIRRTTLQAAINGSTPSLQMIENYKNK